MNLYELSEQAACLQDLLENPEEGQNDEEIAAELESSVRKLGLKVEDICYVIRNFAARAQAFKEEKDRLAAREKAATNTVKRLNDYVLNALQMLNLSKMECGIFSISRCKSTSVQVTDEALIPQEYFEQQPPKLLKSQIGAALKAGENIAGARLATSEYIRLR